jgi:uncharacterized protein YhbP (UPF0306 family)
MNDAELEKIIREYVTKTPHMSLATVSGNKPWVCEVHFAADDDLNLYFVSKPATRHCQEIEANPNVAGNIVKQHALTESPNGIYFEGQAKAIEASPEEVNRYCEVLGRNADDLAAWLKDGSSRMYKINAENWSAFGNFAGTGNTKYVLRWSKS